MTRTEELLVALDRLGKAGTRGRRSSLAEYRSLRRQAETPGAQLVDGDAIWWKYALAPNVGGDPKSSLGVAEQRALSKASGPVGAFLVPSDLEEQILSVVHLRGSVGRLAREFVTQTGVQLSVPIGSVHGTAAWIGEAAPVTATDETFAQVNLNAFKAGTSIVVSEELALDEAAALDAYLALELGLRIAQLEGTAFVTGSGTGQPQGARDNLTQVAAATGSTTKFTLADLTLALHTVPADYRDQGGAWIVSDLCLRALRREADTAGNPILLNPSDPGRPVMLLGFPVYVDENLAAPAANAKSLMFAGWQAAYGIRRVNGIQLQRQVELFSNSGQLGYRSGHRVDGRVLIAAAGVTLAHSAT